MPGFREHTEVAKALYSVPGSLIGKRVDVRADTRLVRVWHHGHLVKTHPRARPGGRVTDPADLPAGTAAYALRDLSYLQRQADESGPAIGAYAAALLDHPLPWTKMRQVYALLGLVRKWGPTRVDAACARALDAEAVSVALIGRMLDRGTEARQLPRARRCRCRACPLPGSPGTPPTSPSPGHARKVPGEPPPPPQHPPAPGAAQARPADGHPARAAGSGPRQRPEPRRVPRADLVRRGHPPRRHLRRAPRPRRRPGPRHAPGPVGRHAIYSGCGLAPLDLAASISSLGTAISRRARARNSASSSRSCSSASADWVGGFFAGSLDTPSVYPV